MTSIYFVRHAQPVHDWEDDRTRPLSEEGLRDRFRAAEILRHVSFDAAVSSPYRRCLDTLTPCAQEHHLSITVDERLRERQKGSASNTYGMYEKRWADFSFHEPDGESLGMVQARNLEVLHELLLQQEGKNLLIGTHGTALSTILHAVDPAFGCADFLRLIDWMPYVIRLDFTGTTCTGREELFHLHKEFNGTIRADRPVSAVTK